MSGFDHVALALGGGNALGAYQAGAYAALHRHGLRVDHIAGASAGSVNGGIIAGNAPEHRIERLIDVWRPAASASDVPASFWMPSANDTARRSLAATWALTTGRTGMFRPRGTALWQALVGDSHPGVYDTTEMQRTLETAIDYARLNRGDIRFTAAAVDLETGEDVTFDTRTAPVEATHIRASSALPPAFPPVEIAGRFFVDAGLSANLPIDAVLNDLAPGKTLCIAIDLLPLAAPRPKSLGELAERTQDLILAAQSRRSLAFWKTILDGRAAAGAAPAVTIVHLQYADQAGEVAGKAFDFSPETAHLRWAAGDRDMTAVLAAIDAGEIAPGAPGLTIVPHAHRNNEVT